ncbi:hypothetical protein GJ496_007963 [Pomphorhynchus laevis]|nr:hypothetical protein GJ496_007963 [Pomphorhynchus laevis]
MEVLMRNFKIHNAKCSPIKQICFNESDRLLCLIRIDFTVELWSTDGAFLKLIQYPINPGAHISRFISDGRLLVSCIDGSLFNYNTMFPNSELVCHLQDGTPWDFCEYSDNTILVVTENGSLIQYNADCWTLNRHIIYGDNKERLVCICANKKNSWVGVGGAEGTVQFINQSAIVQSAYVQPKAIIWAICEVFSDDSDQFITGDSRGRVYLWQADSATRLYSLTTHSADILCMTSMNNNIYCSGVDSKIVQVIVDKDSLHKNLSISFNSHDVRGLCIDKQRNLLIAASNDGNLRCTDIMKIKPHDKRFGVSTCQPYFSFLRFEKFFFLMQSAKNSCELFLYDFIPEKRYVFRTLNEQDVHCFDLLQTDNGLYVGYCDSAGTVTLCWSSLSSNRKRNPNSIDIKKLSFDKVNIPFPELKQCYRLIKFGESCLALSNSRSIELYSINKEIVSLDKVHTVQQFVVAIEIRSPQFLAWINIDGSVTTVSSKHKQWKPVSPRACKDAVFPRATCLSLFGNKDKSLKTCLIAYSDMSIVEVDLNKKEWTQWTVNVQWPSEWLNMNDLIISIQYVDFSKFLVRLKTSFILIRKENIVRQLKDWIRDHYEFAKSNPFYRLVSAKLSKDKILNVACLSDDAVLKAAPMSAKVKRFNN